MIIIILLIIWIMLCNVMLCDARSQEHKRWWIEFQTLYSVMGNLMFLFDQHNRELKFNSKILIYILFFLFTSSWKETQQLVVFVIYCSRLNSCLHVFVCSVCTRMKANKWRMGTSWRVVSSMWLWAETGSRNCLTSTYFSPNLEGWGGTL